MDVLVATFGRKYAAQDSDHGPSRCRQNHISQCARTIADNEQATGAATPYQKIGKIGPRRAWIGYQNFIPVGRGAPADGNLAAEDGLGARSNRDRPGW